MNYFKSAIIAGAFGGAALLSAPASAVVIAGVNVGTGNSFQVGSVYESVVTQVDDVLTGYGRVNEINGLIQSEFCPGGCELTFVFGGFKVTSVSPGVDGEIDFSEGYINFYVSAANFTYTSMATAMDGVLFLETVGHAYKNEQGRIGTLLGDGDNLTTSSPTGEGRGYLDVIGGVAAAYFDTNTWADFMDVPGFADIQFNSTFGATCPTPAPELPLCGSADMHAFVVDVPEPISLGLLGSGLLAAGFVGWRRRRS